MERSYPAHWEADVVLRDGGTAHLRPIRADDADRLVEFYAKTSDESKYYRFFSPYPTLSGRDVRRFTQVDYTDRVALIALVGDDMIGVVRYDRVDAGGSAASDSSLAEVAFLIQDPHQGRGLASVLLEHIAAAAGERGVRRFVAHVLPANRRMIGVFREVGYASEYRIEDGVVMLTLDLAPTETSLAVQQSREHRAEARSIERLLTPTSVALVGASRRPATVGDALLAHLRAGGFTGPVYPVNPAGGEIGGTLAYRSVREIPGPVDLAVVAVPAPAVAGVVADCAAKGVHGLVVVSSGFAETGPAGRERQRELVRAARAGGMRVVGPNCLGVLNTAPDVTLNASLSPVMPTRGRIGLFAQSGALGIAILSSTVARGLGLSTFVSAGNRADVSGNDLLQYWEEDRATDVVLLYLESFGNPRKFARLARRVARRKPVAVVKSGRSTQGVPIGHAVAGVSVPDAAVDALFRSAGVIRVPTVDALFDVAQLLAYQPLPGGDRVAILGNSDSLGLLAKDACITAGLTPHEPIDLSTTATAADFRAALSAALDDPCVDSVIVVFIPPLTASEATVADVIAASAASATKPVLATYLAAEGLPAQLRRLDADGVPAHGSVPSYPAPENAVRALAEVTAYARWRRRPPGTVPVLDAVEEAAARSLLAGALGDAAEARLDVADTRALLACYGIDVRAVVPVSSADAAAAAAAELGYPVALKTLAPALRHRSDLGGVRLDIADETEMRRAYGSMTAALGGPEEARPAVQAMARPGVATVIGLVDDPSFGTVVSFGLAGVASELLGDVAYRVLPLTDADAADLVRSVKAAPLLFGYRGARPVDVDALTDVLLRVARLADDHPILAELELNPVIVAEEGLAVLDAAARLAVPPARTDLGPRALSDPR